MHGYPLLQTGAIPLSIMALFRTTLAIIGFIATLSVNVTQPKDTHHRVFLLSFNMLNVVMLCAVMPNVVAPTKEVLQLFGLSLLT